MRKYKCKYDIEFQDLKEIMDFVADKYGKNTGFIYKSADRKTKTEITYKKFREDLDALGSYLISKGLKGKRIVVIGPNSYQWLVAYYAVVINVGVVPKAVDIGDLPRSEKKTTRVFDYRY